MTRWPFRVGRQAEGKASDNDLHLLEVSGGRALHISSAHFEIGWADGRFVLVDRGSACGTIVSGCRIGGSRRGGAVPLSDGDEVVVGTSRSRYVFRFAVEGGSRLFV